MVIIVYLISALFAAIPDKRVVVPPKIAVNPRKDVHEQGMDFLIG